MNQPPDRRSRRLPLVLPLVVLWLLGASLAVPGGGFGGSSPSTGSPSPVGHSSLPLRHRNDWTHGTPERWRAGDPSRAANLVGQLGRLEVVWSLDAEGEFLGEDEALVRYPALVPP